MVGKLFDIQPSHILLVVPKTLTILQGRKVGLSNPKILKQAYIDNRTYLVSISKVLIFSDNWTYNLDFSVNYRLHPPLLMSEFDSHQVLLCLLWCYILLVHLLYFWFEFWLPQGLISFLWLLAILILDWWFMRCDPIKLQSWSFFSLKSFW